MTRCLSYDDLTKLLVKHGLAVRIKPLAKLKWNPLEKKQIEALDELKKASIHEFEDLLILYDPESTGLIGLSDFYLLLKDLFINHKEVLLYMNDPSENLFEAEGSYKELMSKLDTLVFEEVGLCKKMYQKAKNVSIEFAMFWMIIGALLQTGILKMAFDKKSRVGASYQTSMASPAEDESFEERARKLIKRLEAKMGDEDNNAQEQSMEEETNRSQPELGENLSSHRAILIPDTKSYGRSSKSQPPNSQKKFKLPTEIMEQLEKNKSKEQLNNSVSRADSSKNIFKSDLNNSLVRQDSNSQHGKQDSMHKIVRQNTSKRNMVLEDLAPYIPKKTESNFLPQPNKDSNMECIPEKSERRNSLSHDVRDKSKDEKKNAKCKDKSASPQSKLNSILLKHSEAIWKKALSEIFCFYNKLQKQTKGEYSFENFKEKMNHMSLGEWMKFCNDFELQVIKPKLEVDSQKEYNRKFLTNLYKKESKGSLGINFNGFQVGSCDQGYLVPALRTNRTWKRASGSQSIAGVSQAGNFQPGSRLELLSTKRR